MSKHTAARGLGESSGELQEVLEGFIEYAEVNGLPKKQVDRIRVALAALESEEVVAEVKAQALKYMCVDFQPEYRIPLRDITWPTQYAAPSQLNVIVRILAVKGK